MKWLTDPNQRLVTLILGIGLILSIGTFAFLSRLDSISSTLSGFVEGDQTSVGLTPTPTIEYLPVVPSPLPTGPVDINTDGDPVLGSQDAPITLIEFTDYQCPFCKQFAQEVIPQLVSDYIDQGQLRLIFKDFPLTGHDNAYPAAQAANCVYRLGGIEMYYRFHNLLFDRQDDWSVLPDSGVRFGEYAVEVGANQSAFDECLDDRSVQDEIDADMADGQAVGVNGTPIWFLNGLVYLGTPPYEEMKELIEAELVM